MATLLKTTFYCICIAVGIMAVFLSILAPEIETYYQNKIRLAQTQAEIAAIKERLFEFNQFISRASKDQDVINILYESQLGLNPENTEEIMFPAVDIAKKAAAQQALAKIMELPESNMPEVPEIIHRLNRKDVRNVLILAGAALILTAYIFVIGIVPSSQKMKNEEKKEI
ncbi:hypothetical protein SMSP2_02045 [Limihaloglobus sulfuriphilus]|uniref:Septum formation initiator n=1 Tax=Limihaloglobus sulfuriphilus TaxID=1851148 RepID=A0A1Q2MGJ8_9BACT|nr:hypothetical protein [Limihaloglobus sulfuriphilus]AQQ71668.1 hypothetical protein SMSP2_02045 [Limihaloglobus sulfuriphilus]